MAKGDKIYVVTAGEYSDYHICAVTTDRERAEFLKKWYWDYDTPEIEEYIDGDLETPTKADLIPIWFISCDPNGEVRSCRIQSYCEPDCVPKNDFGFYAPSEPIWIGFYSNKSPDYVKGYSFSGTVAALDQEQAIKIVKDMRAKKLAERLGI